MLTKTDSTTNAVHDGLALLVKEEMSPRARMIVDSIAMMLNGKVIIQDCLNGALAVNLATLDFPLKVSSEGYTAQEAQAYHDFVQMCAEIS
jgi:hypothetical protein